MSRIKIYDDGGPEIWEKRVWTGSASIEPGPPFAGQQAGVLTLTVVTGVVGLAAPVLRQRPEPPLGWLVIGGTGFFFGFQFCHVAYRIRRRFFPEGAEH